LRGSEALCRFKLASEGRLDIELPLRASEGDESDEVELSWFIWSSRPRARAKLVTDNALAVLASEFFLGASLPGSAAAAAGCRWVCADDWKSYSSLFRCSSEGDSSGSSCSVEFWSVGMPKSNPPWISSLSLRDETRDETTDMFESREKAFLLGVRRGAGGTGGVSSINVLKPRVKLFVDDLAVESP
jgi:hypothetical protein